MARRLGISAPAVCLHLRRLISDGRVQILHKGRGGLQFKIPEVGATELVR
jgi:predicted ArsR family transcriptional regulator